MIVKNETLDVTLPYTAQLHFRWENSLAPVIQLPEYNPDKLDNVILKEAPRKRFCKISNVNIIGLEYCI